MDGSQVTLSVGRYNMEKAHRKQEEETNGTNQLGHFFPLLASQRARLVGFRLVTEIGFLHGFLDI